MELLQTSALLQASFICENAEGSMYWLPLLNKFLMDHQFQFQAPALPEGHGYYTYRRIDGFKSAENGHFRNLWDVVCSGVTEVSMIFWFQANTGENRTLELTLEGNIVKTISFTSHSSNFETQPLEEAIAWLRYLVMCTKEMCDLYAIASGKVAWVQSESISSIIALYGFDEDPFIETNSGDDIKEHFNFENLPNGKYFYSRYIIPMIRKTGRRRHWELVDFCFNEK